jgi:hypothetical protein
LTLKHLKPQVLVFAALKNGFQKEMQNIREEGALKIILSSSTIWQMSKLRLREGK